MNAIEYLMLFRDAGHKAAQAAFLQSPLGSEEERNQYRVLNALYASLGRVRSVEWSFTKLEAQIVATNNVPEVFAKALLILKMDML